jgi:hypothetical protein
MVDNIALAKGLNHSDEGKEYFDNAANQPNLNSLLPDKFAWFHYLLFQFTPLESPVFKAGMGCVSEF